MALYATDNHAIPRDINNAPTPIYVKALLIEGINYGDNTNAVWGLSWQDNYIYVGGTNTDAVIMRGREVRAAFKSPTTADVGSGIANALTEVLRLAEVNGAPAELAGELEQLKADIIAGTVTLPE